MQKLANQKTDKPEEQLAALADKIRAESRTLESAVSKFAMSMLSRPTLLRALVEMYFATRFADAGRGDSANLDRVAGTGARTGREGGAIRSVHARPSEPSEARKKAAFDLRLKLAKTVLDTFKVPDGRPIGKVMFFELPGLRRRSLRDAYIYEALMQFVANPSSNARIEDAVKPVQFEHIMQEAERVTNDPV